MSIMRYLADRLLSESTGVIVGKDGGIRRVTWRGKEWLLVGSLEEGGAIADRESYQQGEASYAYLDGKGIIRRFGQQIGVLNQIVDLGPAGELKIREEAIVNMLDDEWKAASYLWAAEKIMN
jgi:hypothetical protein